MYNAEQGDRLFHLAKIIITLVSTVATQGLGLLHMLETPKPRSSNL